PPRATPGAPPRPPPPPAPASTPGTSAGRALLPPPSPPRGNRLAYGRGSRRPAAGEWELDSVYRSGFRRAATPPALRRARRRGWYRCETHAAPTASRGAAPRPLLPGAGRRAGPERGALPSTRPG